MKSNHTVTFSGRQAKPPGSRQERGLATRARILATAIGIFAAKGYDGASVDEIVEAAGVNKRMVYHYFENKLGLYREVLRDVYGRLSKVEIAAVAEHADLDEMLESVIIASFDFLERNTEFVQLLHWENLQQGRHLDASAFGLTKAPILDSLATAVRESSRRRRIRPDLDPRHLLINIIGLCLIYFSNRFTLSMTVDMDLHSKNVRERGMAQIIAIMKSGIRNS